MATIDRVTVAGHAMDVYVEAPRRSAPGPAILLMYHRGGIDEFTRMLVARLAEGGYVVAVPDVSHRVSRDVPMTDRKQFLKDSDVVADMRATVEFLRARSDVAADRIVIMGHCMGGRMCLMGAGAIDAFKGAVVFYGGGVMLSWGNEGWTPFETLKDIRCPVIGFFGGKDTNPSPADVDAIDTELTKRGVSHTFHRYPKVGHGFQHPANAEEEFASEDAWTKTFAFLRSVVGT
ncbi:MAG: dienelactone hydrolase family protein [Gemmatimonas sp.]